MKYRARLPATNVNVTPVSPIREFLVLLGGLAAILIGVYIALGLAVDLLVPYLPIKVEQRMAGLFSDLGTDDEAADPRVRSVQAIVDRLQGDCADLPYSVTVHVAEDEHVNAAALPGGHIVVFSGLLETVTSENELAFVMAHELGHFANRDHLRVLGRSAVFLAISAAVLGSDSSLGNLLADGIGLTELGFSRTQESRADTYALSIVNCAYGHVGGSTDFFKKMAAEDQTGVFGHYFSTHPENRDRMDRLTEIARERGYRIETVAPLSFSPDDTPSTTNGGPRHDGQTSPQNRQTD